jgi:hypothetical protein
MTDIFVVRVKSEFPTNVSNRFIYAGEVMRVLLLKAGTQIKYIASESPGCFPILLFNID